MHIKPKTRFFEGENEEYINLENCSIIYTQRSSNYNEGTNYTIKCKNNDGEKILFHPTNNYERYIFNMNLIIATLSDNDYYYDNNGDVQYYFIKKCKQSNYSRININDHKNDCECIDEPSQSLIGGWILEKVRLDYPIIHLINCFKISCIKNIGSNKFYNYGVNIDGVNIDLNKNNIYHNIDNYHYTKQEFIEIDEVFVQNNKLKKEVKTLNERIEKLENIINEMYSVSPCNTEFIQQTKKSFEEKIQVT